jgi:hypothetical protein
VTCDTVRSVNLAHPVLQNQQRRSTNLQFNGMRLSGAATVPFRQADY